MSLVNYWNENMSCTCELLKQFGYPESATKHTKICQKQKTKKSQTPLNNITAVKRRLGMLKSC